MRKIIDARVLDTSSSAAIQCITEFRWLNETLVMFYELACLASAYGEWLAVGDCINSAG